MATRSVEGILCCVECSDRKRSLEKHHKMGVMVCGTVLNEGRPFYDICLTVKFLGSDTRVGFFCSYFDVARFHYSNGRR